jgi:hypothetical protein
MALELIYLVVYKKAAHITKIITVRERLNEISKKDGRTNWRRWARLTLLESAAAGGREGREAGLSRGAPPL